MQVQDLMIQIANLLNTTPEEVAAQIAARREAARRNFARKNARYTAALACMSDIQSVVIDSLEANGAKMAGKVYQNRRSGRVAVMMVKNQVWNGIKGRCMDKLMMVYPDGSRTETFEKSISIKKEF